MCDEVSNFCFENRQLCEVRDAVQLWRSESHGNVSKMSAEQVEVKLYAQICAQ